MVNQQDEDLLDHRADEEPVVQHVVQRGNVRN